MLEELKKKVYHANMRLRDEGLVVLTWGNASAYDPETELVVIKPSGVSYGLLKPRDMVVVNLNGEVVEGKLNPSSDTPTHLELYRRFEGLRGVVHTHSVEATAWAQAIAKMARLTEQHGNKSPLAAYVGEKHYQRKHGKNAYYGQK